ncbi:MULTISPECIES: hypothetical protein [Bacillus subtilis group]|uniref:hypothetical protein n=1 Tax=Bacillus subtilis group TaxID=653685 RepID=UPI001B96F804|nr:MULTISPECIES: hypothetical protein [Bacillus subtilis group]MEC1273358.1 hypothetical protein [Bacillus subtilis]MEC1315914.1 hypothetical protein [Bacillus subtilis]MEC1496242.1 hypothetical protein [Bacillus subtilis]MEC1612735.1 hypothetical protein [Bacillus mojavensis]CAF1813825.1 hypothetical protein NRS6148_01096 [Bacillus subtilis]
MVDKALIELYDLADDLEVDEDVVKIAKKAINTIKNLRDKNKHYELALKVCRATIQKNLSSAMYKDEYALLEAFETTEKALNIK